MTNSGKTFSIGLRAAHMEVWFAAIVSRRRRVWRNVVFPRFLLRRRPKSFFFPKFEAKGGVGGKARGETAIFSGTSSNRTSATSICLVIPKVATASGCNICLVICWKALFFFALDLHIQNMGRGCLWYSWVGLCGLWIVRRISWGFCYWDWLRIRYVDHHHWSPQKG